MSLNKAPAFAFAILASALAVAASAQASRNRDGVILAPHGGSILLHIHSGRPMMRAALTLEQRYGYAITYEDPSYTYSDDILDATSEVRRDHRAAGPGIRKIMVPRSSQLSIQIPASTCISPSEMESILAQLIGLQKAGSREGHFRLAQARTGSIFHVIPTEMRGRSGDWAEQASPLDTRISFPATARTEGEVLGAIASAVSSAAHVHVEPMIGSGIVIGIPAREHKEFTIGADDETAREVLTRMLQDSPQRQSWTLTNGVETGPDDYLLDIIDLPATAGCQTPPPPPPPPASTPECINCAPPSSPPISQ